MIEIERKFLVKSDVFKSLAFKKDYIKQGFLNTHPERTVRVRIQNNDGYITVKGKSNTAGTSRFEWEKKIALEEAKVLLDLCESGILEKVRYFVKLDKQTAEIDVFEGLNKGLILAEIELQNESETLSLPDWIGEEVTGQIKYYNSRLSLFPFTSWDK